MILGGHAPAYGLHDSAIVLADRHSASETKHHVLLPAENIPIVDAPPSEDCPSRGLNTRDASGAADSDWRFENMAHAWSERNNAHVPAGRSKFNTLAVGREDIGSNVMMHITGWSLSLIHIYRLDVDGVRPGRIRRRRQTASHRHPGLSLIHI